MIIEIEQHSIASDMQWRPLLVRGSVHKQARADKRPYVWSIPGEEFYGLISDTDVKYKKKKSLYSAAILFRKALGKDGNVLGIFSLGDDHYLICGLHRGRPKDGFDTVITGDTAMGKVVEKFAGLCKEESYRLVGDVKLPSMEPAGLDTLMQQLGTDAELVRVRVTHAKEVAVVVAVLAMVGVGNYGWYQYKAMQHRKEMLAAQQKQKSAQQRYDEAIAAIRLQPTWRTRDIGFFWEWAGRLSRQIGGWYLTKADCSFADNALNCTLTYDRSNYALATNKSFLDDLQGAKPDSVDFDGKNVSVHVRVEHLPTGTYASALDAAQDYRATTIGFGSTLQELTAFGDQSLKSFDPFGVPAGINPGELAKPPVQAGHLDLSLPLRALPLVADFPAAVVLDKATLTVAKQPQLGNKSRDSSLQVALSGRIFAKPQ
jgi:hypothetical protein